MTDTTSEALAGTPLPTRYDGDDLRALGTRLDQVIALTRLIVTGRLGDPGVDDVVRHDEIQRVLDSRRN
ncbi:hypothetical protein F0L68_33590 [Solihabitans fulvus]|uniref:Uncharacterized protein n=1 Tax=Solihabitans fulvus TaxID=1892852 RepID=A0A5B2WRE8_9PSEU|nr:hypothetical protein [Solihabitans fulvus]KAA2253086.1 hypothetical protein F0L68_33590 [Solihabitans fulvus]